MKSGLSFSAADLAQTRFAVSPMWEVVTSFRLLQDANDPPLHRRWAAQVRPRLVHAGLDRGWLAELVPARGYLADFLNPTPASPFPTLVAELDAIRRTTPAQVRKDLEMLGVERTDRPSPGSGSSTKPPRRPWRRSPPRSSATGSSPSPPTGPASASSWRPTSSIAPGRWPSTAPPAF